MVSKTVRAKSGIGLKIEGRNVVDGGGIIAVPVSSQDSDMRVPGAEITNLRKKCIIYHMLDPAKRAIIRIPELFIPCPSSFPCNSCASRGSCVQQAASYHNLSVSHLVRGCEQ